MPRPATGSIVEKTNSRGTVYAIRFRALGRQQYVTLGYAHQGWTYAKAEAELANVLADVRRGLWQPPVSDVAPEIVEEPTFHVFASEWLAAKAVDLADNTVEAYTNELSRHLLPFFHKHTLRQITVAEVDRYREHKLTAYRRYAALKAEPVSADDDAREAHLQRVEDAKAVGPSYINATITRLGAILDVADERGLIDRNPVRVNPRNRKAKVKRSRRPYLDRPEQIAALLAAAAQLDREAASRRDRDTCLRRPLIATLLFAGLRISEALQLRWRDVDIPGGRLHADLKTEAGDRWVPIVPALREELLARKMSTTYDGVDDFVFCTLKGRKMSKDNTRSRILLKACEIADQTLIADGAAPLPVNLTQHSLRHTYISLRVALGDDLAAISRDAGHADINVTFRIYTHVMALAEGDREKLRALVDGGFVHSLSSGADLGAALAEADDPRNDKGPHEMGPDASSWGGTRTPDLTIMSRAL